MTAGPGRWCMRPDPFPSPEWDGEEPDGSVPPPAAEAGPDAEDADPAEQGLFVCLPAKDLDVSRFAQHGESDSMPPGPLLATVVHALAGEDGGGLAALSDDQLVGVIAATRRMESRIAWTQLAAIREFAARRPASQSPGRAEFAADELSASPCRRGRPRPSARCAGSRDCQERWRWRSRFARAGRDVGVVAGA